MQEVTGSIPVISTKKALYFVESIVLFFLLKNREGMIAFRKMCGIQPLVKLILLHLNTLSCIMKMSYKGVIEIGLFETNGLSLEILEGLSYRSRLGKSLKNNLNAFEKEPLLQDALGATEWFDANELLGEVALDYRIKSEESIRSKYERYYPDRPVQKVFNDLLGFRTLCTSYREVLRLESPRITVVDMSHGKAHDDGYRGVHLYYRLDNFHYPIELQFNTFLDRQLNDWLHDYVYKKNYPATVGRALRIRYEHGEFTETESFQEALNNVLSDCER